MRYYLDGYNLLFRKGHAGENLEKEREELIAHLAHRVSFLCLDFTIVFDSHHAPGEATLSRRGEMDIIFSSQGETADEQILSLVKKEDHPLQVTVITSDQKLAWQVRRKGVKTETIDAFLTWLNKRYQTRQEKPTSPKPLLPPTPPKKLKTLQDRYLEAFGGQQEPPKPERTLSSLPLPPLQNEEDEFQRYLRLFEEPPQNP